MKKIIFAILLVSLLTISIAFGQGNANNLQGLNGENNSNKAIDNPEPMLIQEQRMVQERENAQDVNAIQNRIQSDENFTTNEKRYQIQERNSERKELRSGNISAETKLEMTEENNQLQVKLSNGKNALVKTMPDTASERAIERLQLKVCNPDNNCTIELKEVGANEQARAAYEVKAEKNAKVLGLFKAKMQVSAQVDAETGEVIQSKKPWWAFLATQSEE